MQVATTASARIRSLLADPSGVAYQMARLSGATPEDWDGRLAAPISGHNIAAEVQEKAGSVKYPQIQVYCEKVSNMLREKFRTFSGSVRMAVEIRVSQDRLDGLDEQLQLYSSAVIAVLDGNRGDMGSGLFFPGAYEVTYGAVRHGGKNYLQTAKIAFDLEGSSN